MNFSILETERTNNFTDPAIQTKIGSLWKRNAVTVQKVLKEGGTIACVYHDYQTDFKGDYSVSLCKEDYANPHFDTSNYQWKTYVVDSTDDLGIINTWHAIWLDEERGNINRVYAFDFEQYNPNGEINILVAIH